MIDNVVADLGQTVNIGLSRSEVTAFYGVVKQTPDAIAVVRIILGGIDASLGGDTVRTAGTVLYAERLDVIAQFGQRCRRGTTGQTGSDHNDFELSLIGRIDQFQFKKMFVPFFCKGSSGNFSIKRHVFSFLTRHGNVNRQQAEAESDSQAEYNAQQHDQRHVFWVVGADCLEGAPKSVADVDGRHNYGKYINDNVYRTFKGL